MSGPRICGSRGQTTGAATHAGHHPEPDEIKVYRLVEGRFERTALLSLEQGDVLTSPLLPGLTLRLAEIFRE